VLVFQPQTAAAAKSSDVTGTAAKRSKLLGCSSNGEGEKRAKHVVPPRSTSTYYPPEANRTGCTVQHAFPGPATSAFVVQVLSERQLLLYYMLMASSLDLDSFTPPNSWGLS
jgi:hypothetical protein